MMGTTSVLAAPYDDEFGNEAPAAVRRAADQTASGYLNYAKNHPFQGFKWTYDSTCCCIFPNTTTTYSTFYKRYDQKPKPFTREYLSVYHDTVVQKSLANQAYQDLQFVQKVLLKTINDNVKNPVSYEGDLDLSLDWTLCDDGGCWLNEPVESSVMKLVKKMGGWK